MSTILYRQKGEQFFTSVNGVVTPLAGGYLYYYTAGTTSAQNTYSELTGTVVNANPVQLDAYGRIDVPIYFGSANNYKEVLTDINNNTIAPWPFDNIPAAPSTTSPPLTGFERLYQGWTALTSANSPVTLLASNAGAAYEVDTSSGNVAITLPAISAMQSGTGFTVDRVDTGAAGYSLTLAPNGSDQINGVNAALSIAPKSALTVSSDGSAWQIVWGTSIVVKRPGGRLTLTSGTPVLGSDAFGQQTVYYTAYEDNYVPIWGGSAYNYFAFSSDLSLALTASILPSSTIVDVFAINNSGPLALGAGPTWSSSTPGSCSRGTGAGTTQLARQNNGIWTNANIITLKNGSTTYSNIPVGQATYLGSIYGDAAAGQTSCYVSTGQSRKWGVWNAYNRRPIVLSVSDPTNNWSYGTAAWRSSNGNSANSCVTFTGLPEQFIVSQFAQYGGGGAAYNGIGLNSNASPTGMGGVSNAAVSQGSDLISVLLLPPSLGTNQIYCIESAAVTSTYAGGGLMLMYVAYEG